jgi:hypothetical protein
VDVLVDGVTKVPVLLDFQVDAGTVAAAVDDARSCSLNHTDNYILARILNIF